MGLFRATNLLLQGISTQFIIVTNVTCLTKLF